MIPILTIQDLPTKARYGPRTHILGPYFIPTPPAGQADATQLQKAAGRIPSCCFFDFIYSLSGMEAVKHHCKLGPGGSALRVQRPLGCAVGNAAVDGLLPGRRHVSGVRTGNPDQNHPHLLAGNGAT